MSVNEAVKYIAENLIIKYHVIANYGPDDKMHEITLKNGGDEKISTGEWSIYLYYLRLPDEVRRNGSYKLPGCEFTLEHVDGSLFKLSPTVDFKGIQSNDFTVIKYKSQTIVARNYIFPRWYVAAPAQKPRIIESTNDDYLSFVTKFNSATKWRRSIHDNSHPFESDERYKMYSITDMHESPIKVIPTPVQYKISTSGKGVDLNDGKWVVCNTSKVFEAETKQLATYFGLSLLPKTEPCQPSNVVQFVVSEVEGVQQSDEAYQISIDAAVPHIEIKTQGSAGAFYAVQTLLSLAETNDGELQHSLPAGIIRDAPRLGYRGLHIDVARNFIKADDLIYIIETIALYKINKLHLHLTDDEGWRIEIKGLPELTEVGSVRCHTEDEADAIYPQLGSGPNKDTSGTGYFTVEDYKRILKAAARNHVEVIPEIDTPGHCHAAIRSMQARFRRFMKEGKINKAKEFLLNDVDDTSEALYFRRFRKNAINPCMESTYKFVDHVVKAIKDMHADIQPLKTIHMGGDEVAKDSWSQSPICNNFLQESTGFPKSNKDLQEYFMRRVSEICGKKHGLSLGVWEDGMLGASDYEPYTKPGMDTLIYAWKNAWTEKSIGPYKLANAGYKVIMSQATHLYFDHPQEPDPEEVGLIWATRYIDDKKVFDFRPGDLYGNAQFDANAYPFTAEEKREIRESHPVLTKPENIIGMQAQLWSELIRDVSLAHSQLFPRLIAFAERAWHKAPWEESDAPAMQSMREKDWSEFAMWWDTRRYRD